MDEHLHISPTIAMIFGINEAIILEKLDSLLQTSSRFNDDYKWVKYSYEQWQLYFPFWSTNTIARVIRNLEKEGCILSTNKYNVNFTDKIKWYRSDYDKLDQIVLNNTL